MEVRVGDYAFDSSLFNAPNFGSGVIQLAADGSDERAARRGLVTRCGGRSGWRATRYKRAKVSVTR